MAKKMNVIEMKPMRLLPAKPGTCIQCASNHEPGLPHNAESLYYQMRFQMEHGRSATWADACAHLSDTIREEWKAAMKSLGREFTVTASPIAEPFGIA